MRKSRHLILDNDRQCHAMITPEHELQFSVSKWRLYYLLQIFKKINYGTVEFKKMFKEKRVSFVLIIYYELYIHTYVP